MDGSGNNPDSSPKRQLRLARPTTYDVGYGKPPASTRFKPGRSGNPKGRPKGARNRLPELNEERLKAIVIEEAYRTIKVRDGARNVTIPMATAVIRTLAVNAAKGNNRAALIFSNLLQTTERENKELQSQWFETAVDYKHKWDEELARRKRHGIVAEDPLPHPDDIVINPRKGTVRVLGPMTKDEKALFDAAKKMMADLREWIEWCGRRLKRERDPVKRQRLLDSISQDQNLCDRIDRTIPKRTSLDWVK